MDRLTSLMAARGYGERDLFAVRLAVEEAIVNAVKHGHRGDTTKHVQVRYQVTRARVLVQVEDEGTGFNVAAVPDPREPQNITKSHGRGIFFMRHYTDALRYNRRGNCVTLCRRRSPSNDRNSKHARAKEQSRDSTA